MKGQSLDEDMYAGLINVKDLRERTRLSEYNVFGHSAMRLIAEWYPEEMGFWAEIAAMEDVYFISEDGEQRKEAILMQRARVQAAMPQAMTIQMPKVETTPEETKSEKKGFFRK